MTGQGARSWVRRFAAFAADPISAMVRWLFHPHIWQDRTMCFKIALALLGFLLAYGWLIWAMTSSVMRVS